MAQKHNFSAGPAILPKEAIEAAIEALQDFSGTGLPLISVSHRSKEFVAVMEEAVALAKELFNIPSGYEVLFLQGGASTQFCMLPFNYLSSNGTAAYLNTGSWASKAMKEAKLFGEVVEVGSSADENFNYIPKDFKVPSDADYLHITTNNTIYGTEFHSDPQVEVPLVADMSSDIYSRPVDVSRYALIYAGAQKNIGPAGTTMVIVNEDKLKRAEREVPTMLNYQTHIKKESMFNTPPVFAIFVVKETLKWLKNLGGVEKMHEINKAKSDLIYNEIDRNPLFVGTAAKEDRSIMNACFVLHDDSLNNEFMEYCKGAEISGTKGHRSVGGFRASMYNAMDISSVETLVNVMKEFANKYA